MLKTISRLTWAGIAVSVLWFAGISVVALRDWNRRETERAYLYQQCLQETPNVAECRSLSDATWREGLGDVAEDFLIAGAAPIVVLWVIGWLIGRRLHSRRSNQP